MIKDAETHAEEDKKRREEIETRNRADQAVYAAEKMIQDMGDKLPGLTRRRLNRQSKTQERDFWRRCRCDDARDGAVDAGAAQGSGGALQEHRCQRCARR